jgi:hypothetical protein
MTAFEGQQEGERVLYTILPHPIHKYLATARLIFLALFFFVTLWVIGGIIPAITTILRLTGFILGVVLFIAGYWWNLTVFKKSRSYITDRRIIRFDVVSPFFTTKRTLFWGEALKAKAYAQNIVFRSLKIGTIDVEPQVANNEDVRVTDVYYFEDLANYIDKILFTFKNNPAGISAIKPFVAKEKGQRYNESTSRSHET